MLLVYVASKSDGGKSFRDEIMSFAELPFQNHHTLSNVQPVKNYFATKIIAAWWIMFACSSVALSTSTYLAWASLTSSAVAGCGGGSLFDCSHVLHSRWSSVMSVPVSIPAMAIHGLVLTMLLLQPTSKSSLEMRWAIVGFCALTAGAAAIWFIGLQVFWIEHLCSYCLSAHAAGLLLAAVYLWYRPISLPNLRWVGGTATLAISGLVLLQSISVPPKTHEVIEYPETLNDSGMSTIDAPLLFEPPRPTTNPTKPTGEPQAWLYKNQLQLTSITLAAFTNSSAMLDSVVLVNPQDGPVKSATILSSLKLETHAWPLLGKKDAELVFVEMFDYTCEHCQKTHKTLEAVREKYGDRLAIIALPVPIDGKCNPLVKTTEASHAEACELAKLAIAVWSVDREKFSEFHSYLFKSKPKHADALTKAKELVDSEKLTETLKTALPAEYVAKHVAIYQKAGAGNIPKLMFPKTTSVGAIESTAVITQLIEQNLK